VVLLICDFKNTNIFDNINEKTMKSTLLNYLYFNKNCIKTALKKYPCYSIIFNVDVEKLLSM